MILFENAGIICKCPRQKNTFYWETPNYFACDGADDEDLTVFSPCFVTFDRNWRLALITNKFDDGRKYVGFFLWMMPFTFEKLNIKVKLTFLNCDGSELIFCQGDVDLNGHFGSWTFTQLSTFRQNKYVVSPKGLLKFACIMEGENIELKKFDIPQGIEKSKDGVDIKESEDVKVDVSNEKVKKENREAKGVDRLIKNLENLLNSGQNSDVILKVEDHEFRGHRGILAARSPVFASMLQHDTKENATGIFDIPDCSEVAFQIFLFYIYTGIVDYISSDTVYDVYYTADKYQVNDLKSECVEFMEKSLSVENFCETMALSLQHNESGLQGTATRFFCENVKTIIKTVQWEKFMKDYRVQAKELYRKAINA